MAGPPWASASPQWSGSLAPTARAAPSDRCKANWDKERGQNKDKPDNSAIMQPIAHDLSESQINAVAAYVSLLN